MTDPIDFIRRAHQLQEEINDRGMGKPVTPVPEVETCNVFMRKTGTVCTEPAVAGKKCARHGGNKILSRVRSRNLARDEAERRRAEYRDGLEITHAIEDEVPEWRSKEDSERVTDVTIVGFGGYYGCGKDAAADHLVATRDFEKRYFSEPLHEWLLTQNPWIKLDREVWSLEGWKYEAGEFVKYTWLDHHLGYVAMKEIHEVRDLLQKTGTQAGRRLIHEDIWADRMYVLTKARIEKLRQYTRYALLRDGERRELTDIRIVITGVRYPNELEAIRRLGGTAIWIDRPSATAAHEQRLKEDSERVTQGLEPLVHESDLMLTADDFDLTIMNDGTLAQLHERTARWFDSLA